MSLLGKGPENPPLNRVHDAFQEQLDFQGDPRIWAVGGGKGGVGKSLVTANVSLCLALMGYKVTTIDLDLGGANLHTCLGIPIPSSTLSDYLNKKVKSLSDLVTETPIPNLSIISGAQDELGIANMKQMHKNKILTHLRQIDSDFIIFDLGAGTSANTLDFFISASQGVLTVLPEPTSIENTYRFIKSIYYRRLKMLEEYYELGGIIEKAMNSKIGDKMAAPVEMINTIIKIDEEKGLRLKNEISRFRPKLIINQVRTQSDIDIGFSMQSICRRYFGIELDYLGYLDYDATVWQSVKKRRPLLLEFPNSRLVTNFDRIVQKLLKLQQ